MVSRILKNKRLSLVSSDKRSTPSWLSQRKGWIRVVEAFFAIVLIGGVIVIVTSQTPDNNQDSASGIYDSELAILQSIELNDSLRADILSPLLDAALPLELSDSAFPASVKTEINNKIPAYLACNARICTITEVCVPSHASSNVYIKQVTIFANLTINNPRKLTLACGLK